MVLFENQVFVKGQDSESVTRSSKLDPSGSSVTRAKK